MPRVMITSNIEHNQYMHYSMQATPSFSQKLSLSKILQNHTFAPSKDTPLSHNNHISWEESTLLQSQH